MNQNASSPIDKVPEQQIRLFGLSCNFRLFLAVILGLLSFLLLFGLGAALEGALLNELSGKTKGKAAQFALTVAAVIIIAAYFLIAQYFLSRGNPQPLRKAWPLVIALNFPLLCASILCLVLETKAAALGSLMLVMFTVACSYAGAALAARSTLGSAHGLV